MVVLGTAASWQISTLTKLFQGFTWEEVIGEYDLPIHHTGRSEWNRNPSELCRRLTLCDSRRTIPIPRGTLTQRTPLTVYLCTLLQHRWRTLPRELLLWMGCAPWIHTFNSHSLTVPSTNTPLPQASLLLPHSEAEQCLLRGCWSPLPVEGVSK